MSRRGEDRYTNTEADAGRYEADRARAEYDPRDDGYEPDDDGPTTIPAPDSAVNLIRRLTDENEATRARVRDGFIATFEHPRPVVKHCQLADGTYPPRIPGYGHWWVGDTEPPDIEPGDRWIHQDEPITVEYS